MKHMLWLILPIVAMGVLVACDHASAGLIPDDPSQVDYWYQSPAPTQPLVQDWTKVVDPDPSYGTPSWFTVPYFPFNADTWIAVPNQAQSDKLKHFWFQVTWDTVPTNLDSLPKPILWVPESSVVLVGSGATTVGNVSAWEWIIDPQPSSEIVQIPGGFPWSSVIQIDVASRCVPEPSTLVMGVIGALVCLGVGRRWRKI